MGERGPFDEVLVASRGFGWSRGEDGVVASDLPELASGPMSAGELALPGATVEVDHLAPGPAFFTGGPDWGDARLGYFAVPARYRDSPVETIDRHDIRTLMKRLIAWAGRGEAVTMAASAIPDPECCDWSEHAEAAGLLGELVEVYGVSTREAPIRDAVRGRLPEWAEPEVDASGNLLVRFGDGEERVAFVAHLDEVGFTVDEILADGRLRLTTRGGLAPSAWEAQPALVHAASDLVPGVFEPRAGWLTAAARRPPEALTVFLGASSREEVEALGVAPGDAVTMPKKMRRLGPHRAVGRAFDDRVGTTALLLALERIDPRSVGRRYTFAWVVEEEIGLHGSAAMAEDLADGSERLDRVHPVDTFVASDDPFPDKGFALTPLGEGVVLRAMDNGYLADRATIDYVEGVAAEHGVPTRIGFTGGGNDGIAFLHLGATNLPLSWPGRYSHSPVEVMDLRDLEALVDLIVALVEDPVP